MKDCVCEGESEVPLNEAVRLFGIESQKVDIETENVEMGKIILNDSSLFSFSIPSLPSSSFSNND
jgi:hypothetical protein